MWELTCDEDTNCGMILAAKKELASDQMPCVTVCTRFLSCYAVLTRRFGTETADVPGQQGERVTVVCSPSAGKSRRPAVLSAAPPGTRTGQPMTLSNHVTGKSAAPCANTIFLSGGSGIAGSCSWPSDGVPAPP